MPDFETMPIGTAARLAEAERKAKLWDLVDELRAEEGDTVKLCSDNAEFSGPGCIILCEGEWTNWAERAFAGENLVEALEEAVRGRKAVS